MTMSVSQTALGPACASSEPFSSYSIHLDNTERVFLLAVLCEYELLLRKASRVFGYVDLDSRADIARPLFDQLSGVPGQIWECDFRVESDSELSELRVALDAACDLVASYDGYDYDVAARLRTAILDKISSSGEPAEPNASSSVQTVQRALPFFGSDSAEPSPVESGSETPRIEIEPHGDGWFVIGYWADGEEAFLGYFPDYDDALEEANAFMEREC